MTRSPVSYATAAGNARGRRRPRHRDDGPPFAPLRVKTRRAANIALELSVYASKDALDVSLPSAFPNGNVHHGLYADLRVHGYTVFNVTDNRAAVAPARALLGPKGSAPAATPIPADGFSYTARGHTITLVPVAVTRHHRLEVKCNLLPLANMSPVQINEIAAMYDTATSLVPNAWRPIESFDYIDAGGSMVQRQVYETTEPITLDQLHTVVPGPKHAIRSLGLTMLVHVTPSPAPPTISTPSPPEATPKPLYPPEQAEISPRGDQARAGEHQLTPARRSETPSSDAHPVARSDTVAPGVTTETDRCEPVSGAGPVPASPSRSTQDPDTQAEGLPSADALDSTTWPALGAAASSSPTPPTSDTDRPGHDTVMDDTAASDAPNSTAATDDPHTPAPSPSKRRRTSGGHRC